MAGNSLGGWVALETALAGAARTVTAIAPAGLWPRPLAPRRDLARQTARAALPALNVLLRSDRLRRLAMAGTTAHPERVPPAAVEHLVRSYASAPGFPEVNRAMRASRFEHLAEIAVPVTLGWPEHDRLVARPRDLPPSVRNVPLPGCGHLPTYDDPGAVARLLLEGSAGYLYAGPGGGPGVPGRRAGFGSRRATATRPSARAGEEPRHQPEPRASPASSPCCRRGACR